MLFGLYNETLPVKKWKATAVKAAFLRVMSLIHTMYAMKATIPHAMAVQANAWVAIHALAEKESIKLHSGVI